MNEIVIKNDIPHPTQFDAVIKKHGEFILIGSKDNYQGWSAKEALQLADTIYKLLGEPTREQCFEAGREMGLKITEWGEHVKEYGMKYKSFTDYINEFKTNHL